MTRIAKSDEGLTVTRHVPEAVRDQDLAQAFGKRGIDSNDAGIGGARSPIGALEQGLLRFAFDVEGLDLHGIAAGDVTHRHPKRRNRLTAGCDLCRGLRRLLHRIERKVFTVGIPGRIALHDSNSKAHRHGAPGRFQDLLVVDVAPANRVLEKQVGVVAALDKSDLQQAIGDVRIDRM